MPYTYEYPRPMVAVDLVVFGRDGQELFVLLIERGRDPFGGCWAIPGGFLEIDEAPHVGARRELEEETGVTGVAPIPLGFYGEPGRDPRGRVISLVFYALIDRSAAQPEAADDAARAEWFPLEAVPWGQLAFDHDQILRHATEQIRELT